MTGRFSQILRLALVIARRDYVSTVFSRSFVMFLLGPVIAISFAGVIGGVSGRTDDVALRPMLAVIATPEAAAPLKAAYDRLDRTRGDLFDLDVVAPAGNAAVQVQTLLTAPKHTATAVLTDWPGAPALHGPSRQLGQMMPDVQLVLDDVALVQQLDRARLSRPKTSIARVAVDPAPGGSSGGRHVLARAAQTVLFMLTILLAGMLMSTVVEEKSNKVMEVLAAAVPVDAIFLGKLIAMLGMSLTGIAVWGSLLGGILLAVSSSFGPIPVPATGWPVFVLLGVLYFVMNYMIIGGLFLGIGSQAATVREIQTLSMPATMMQLAIFALGSAVLSDLNAPLGIFAALLPVSSPLTMLARGAEEAALWPHLLALVWQAIWVALIIRFAAKRFRIGVLKSGAPKRGWFRRKPAAI